MPVSRMQRKGRERKTTARELGQGPSTSITKAQTRDIFMVGDLAATQGASYVRGKKLRGTPFTTVQNPKQPMNKKITCGEYVGKGR